MTNENTHGYYSYVLNKPFKTVKELDAAEAEYNKANEEKKQAKLVRADDAAKVQDAANAYLALVKENSKKKEELKKAENEAYDKYHELLDEFADKHSGYRLEYKKNGETVEFKVEEAKASSLEDMLAEQNKFFKNFFDSFWF